MISAQEMRERSIKGYMKRYTAFIAQIEATMIKRADNGYTMACIEFDSNEYPEWEASPLLDFLKGLPEGYTYQTERWVSKFVDGKKDEDSAVTIKIFW